MVEKKSRKTSLYLVPALERGLKILEILAAHPGGLQMNGMKELNLPAASLYRMLVTLTELGYIVKENSDRYRLGRKLLSLGYQALDHSNLVEMSAVFQRTLRDMVNETVALGVISGGEGVVVDTVRSEQPVCVYVQIGHHFPLHTAAPAKAVLAFLPGAEQTRLLDNIVFTRFTDRTITDKKSYLVELEKVRTSGVAFDLGEEISDLRCVAAPVFNSRSYPVAALWVTGPESRLNEEKLHQISRQVKETAEKISQCII